MGLEAGMGRAWDWVPSWTRAVRTVGGYVKLDPSVCRCTDDSVIIVGVALRQPVYEAQQGCGRSHTDARLRGRRGDPQARAPVLDRGGAAAAQVHHRALARVPR